MSAITDMFRCVENAIAASEKAVEIKDATAGPERSTLDGYSGAYAVKHIQKALRELEQARDLLTPVAANSTREETHA